MKLGNFECYEIVEGYFKLDGGAMFGSIPKTLWEKKSLPDEQNRIRMALRTLLILCDDKKILIDTGIGHKFPEKLERIYAIDHSQTDIHRALEKHKLETRDISDVILTHLHFDHVGGATYRDSNNNLQLTFPNATWHIHTDNINLCKTPNPKDKASYLEENISPILDSGRLNIIDKQTEILPGISYVLSNGHTTGMMCPLLQSNDQSLLYCADLIPTAAHIPLPWVMGYDLYALTTMEEKKEVMQQVIRNNTILFLEHDAAIAACHVTTDPRGRYQAGEIIDMN